MKCQPLKNSKNPQQVYHVHSKGKHRLSQAYQNTSCDENLKHQDYGLTFQDRILRQGSQNPRCNKMSTSDVSPSVSPTFGTFYAGAKFNGAPSPTDLPKPPPHWTCTPFKMSSGGVFPTFLGGADKRYNFSSQVKMLVNAPV